MKEIVKDLYDIDVITFIKINEKTYKLKTNDKDYSLKYIDKDNIETIIEKLKLLKIDTFLFPIKNKYNKYISNYEGTSFIVSSWLEEDQYLLKDLKLKFYLESLAKLHSKSFYTIKINQSFFNETYDFIANKIDNAHKIIDEYMSKIEKLDYKSPSQWLFLLNYPIYKEAIDISNKALDNFKDKSESKTSTKIAFGYNNFNYKHIFIKEEKILGIENVELAPPVYDIFYSFTVLDEISLDTKLYYEEYFKRYILEDYEKEWLIALLYIPKIGEFTNDEVKNMRLVSSSLNYLKNCKDIEKLIKKDLYEE